MAAPALHLLFTRAFAGVVSDDFLAGVSFPDIRYLGSVSREETHSYDMHQVSDTTSFVAGAAFHHYIDEVRGAYWRNHGIYENLPQSPLSAQALKFCEDILLYDTVEDWQPYIHALRKNHKVPEKFQNALSTQEIEQWYETLAQYISKKPTIDDITSLMGTIGLDSHVAAKVAEIMNTILGDEALVLAIKQYYVDVTETVRKTFTSL